MSEFSAVWHSVALTLAALLPISNPPGSAAIFLSMTPTLADSTRAALATRVARNSFLLLIAATAVGSYVLSFFGLALPIIKIAGGLLVTATGWRLVSDSSASDAKPAAGDAHWGPETVAERSFFPLTFPLTIGPGSVSVAITLGASTRADDSNTLFAIIGTVIGLLLVAVAIHLSFKFAPLLLRALGVTGTVVFLRLSAFILLAVGVQILSDGLIERFHLVIDR